VSDKYVPVILISRDEQLIQAINRSRQPGSDLTVVDPTDTPLPRTGGPVRWWLDQDALDLAQQDLPRPHVLFASRPQEIRGQLGATIVQKPGTTRMLLNLWEPLPEHQTSQNQIQQSDAVLPAWILEYHGLSLTELCRRIVEQLPQRLGYREASLYLYNTEHGALDLAECNHDAPLALSIPIRADDPAPMIAAVRTKRVFESDQMQDRHSQVTRPRLVEHRHYDDRACLILPLFSDHQLQGVINLNSRESEADEPAISLELLTTFLAQSLRFAREFESSRTEARVDEMTGLANYRCAMETIESEIGRAARFGEALSVIMIDLDGLKQVNDSRGHAAGNVLIRHVAGKIRAALRRFDTAARVGGDEFIVILPATDVSGGQQVAKRILESIHGDAASFQDESIPISASLGLAQWQADWSSATLLEAADQAMYAAKNSNRDRPFLSTTKVPTIHKMVAARVELPPGNTSITTQRRSSISTRIHSEE
jgi:diguanylate cyclase (GGDEF)-like protein